MGCILAPILVQPFHLTAPTERSRRKIRFATESRLAWL